jgi:hypothetical protein
MKKKEPEEENNRVAIVGLKSSSKVVGRTSSQNVPSAGPSSLASNTSYSLRFRLLWKARECGLPADAFDLAGDGG